MQIAPKVDAATANTLAYKTVSSVDTPNYRVLAEKATFLGKTSTASVALAPNSQGKQCLIAKEGAYTHSVCETPETIRQHGMSIGFGQEGGAETHLVYTPSALDSRAAKSKGLTKLSNNLYASTSAESAPVVVKSTTGSTFNLAVR